MKRSYKTVNFRAESLEAIRRVNEIIATYQAQGLRLTLRQLYYQLVTVNAIRNEERAYKGLGKTVSEGRLAGLIDWDAIEDRGRRPAVPSEWQNVAELVESALAAYRLPRWKGQSSYVELWVEKDALSGVLAPLADEFHVTLGVNKGYNSQSAMREAAQRIFRGAHPRKQTVVLYLGDHDPSGEDMVRDVRDRLVMFGLTEIDVRKVAITFEQVQQYNPPPNPTKMSDSRAGGYVEKFGDECWEVDALPPNVLADLVREAFEGLVDLTLMETVKDREEADKVKLRTAAARLVRDA